ncbi:MAG TPA: PilC/PilY family type IV pilus protein [Nevskia sp.]|nr:PilC/PilY family type IV pilus protein [Nevskia sp.]
MNTIYRGLPIALLLLLGLCTPPSRADDTDIYAGAANGGAGEPVVMFMLDNTANWSKNDQKIPDLSGSTKTASGQIEAQAIQNVLLAQQTAIMAGLSMFTTSSLSAGGSKIDSGGYIRFGARDMTSSPSTSTNFKVLNKILGFFVNTTQTSAEKINQQSKNESAAFYELYKYFHGLQVYTGSQSSAGNSSPSNQFVDITGNNDDADHGGVGGYTAFGQGLTSGFAVTNSGGTYTYNSPLGAGCAKGYIIYISNNSNFNFNPGVQQFESGGATAVNALTPTTDESWADEWAAFNRLNGIITYVVDVYNANQNTDYSASLIAIASAGGGKYYKVTSQSDLQLALAQILAEIQSVNSTFASASLPVNTTNRTQDLNQVFIGSFRPNPDSAPRWKGNLKQYQIISNAGVLDLGDSLGNSALSATTGYIADCAVSYWTTDTSSVSPPTTPEAYWLNVPDATAQNGQFPVTRSQCVTPATPTSPGLPAGMTSPSQYSDWPDGPAVEKGGAAEVIRKGNTAGAQTSPTFTVNRTVYTASSSALTSLTSASFPSTTFYNWVLGADNDASTLAPGPEKPGNAATNTRPSLHGDVIHSRPQPINYGGTLGTAVYYGSNDGMYRAVDAATGIEKWSFVAPEFLAAANSQNNYSKFQRLYDNSPLVKTPNLPTTITPAPTSKDYFFDGNTGVYQNDDNSKVYIYPSMRRGGRMIYALNVTTPSSPAYLWKFGCPDAADDTGCTTGASGIGQTWSTPTTAFVRGYSTSNPVIVMGGGYDTCEDANTASPSCNSAKGALVYVLDATTGSIIKSYSTTRSVAADPTLATVHTDGFADYAYFADTGGNVYRLDFSDASGNALSSSNWVFHKIASTSSGSGRKFLFAPTVLPTTTASGTPLAAYVALGSGDREHPLITQYPYTTPVTNRFYVLLDDLTTSSRSVVNLDDVTTTDTLYMGDYTNNNCSTVAACQALQVVPRSNPTTPLQVGWFISLVAGTGEQVVTSSVVIAGDVAFSTNRPIPANVNSCTSTLGEARGYNLSLFNAGGALNGDRSGTFLAGGLPASPTLFTTTVGGTVVTGTIGVKTTSCSSAQCPGRPIINVSPRRKVLYWHLSGDNK